MEVAGFVVNDAPAHWDGVPHYVISNAELFQGVNSARGKSEIDRATADKVPRARVSPPLVKIDLNSPTAEESGEHTARQTTAYKHKFRHECRMDESRIQESRKKRSPIVLLDETLGI